MMLKSAFCDDSVFQIWSHCCLTNFFQNISNTFQFSNSITVPVFFPGSGVENLTWNQVDKKKSEVPTRKSTKMGSYLKILFGFSIIYGVAAKYDGSSSCNRVGKWTQGQLIDTTIQKNENECLKHCKDNYNCHGFTYYPNQSICLRLQGDVYCIQ